MLMSTNFRFSLLLARLAFLAAFPLGFSTHIVHAQQQLYPSLKDSVPSITTNGVASAEVVPDIATISIGVDTERPNAADAARDNARATQAVVGEIKAQGIEAKDIKTLSIILTPVYDESTDANGRIIKRTLRGYNAHNSLDVRIRDITKAGGPGTPIDGQRRQQPRRHRVRLFAKGREIRWLARRRRSRRLTQGQ